MGVFTTSEFIRRGTSVIVRKQIHLTCSGDVHVSHIRLSSKVLEALGKLKPLEALEFAERGELYPGNAVNATVTGFSVTSSQDGEEEPCVVITFIFGQKCMIIFQKWDTAESDCDEFLCDAEQFRAIISGNLEISF
jgi:hypothetical protein